MDSESLTYLLCGGHYNVPDRISRGIWPHPPLEFEEVVKHLAHVIVEHPWFPYQPEPHSTGKIVDEWGFIERVSLNEFVYHAGRGHAYAPFLLAEVYAVPFTCAEAAARHYLKRTLHLPGDLDSWKVV